MKSFICMKWVRTNTKDIRLQMKTSERQHQYIYIYNSYRSGFWHFNCYVHNVSAYLSAVFLQVFVEIGSRHGTRNHVLVPIALTITAKYSCFVTHLGSGLNLQTLDDCLFWKFKEPMALNATLCVLLSNSEWTLRTYKLNVLTSL